MGRTVSSPAKKKIVVIDDSPTVLMTVQKSLSDLGYEAITTTKAHLVGTLILQHRPDLVLIDVAMPALRGDRLLRLLRTHKAVPGTKIFLFSSLPAQELADLCRRCDADGFIVKHQGLSNLSSGVQAALGAQAGTHGEND